MSSESRTKSINFLPMNYVFAVLAAIVLLLAGYGFHVLAVQQAHLDDKPYYYTLNMLYHLLSELGTAFMVAVLIAITLERLSKREFAQIAREHEERSKQNVFHYVYGQHLSSLVTHEIENQMLMHHFMKRNLSIVHSVQPFKHNSDYVIVDTTVSCELINVTSLQQEYILKCLTDGDDYSKEIGVTAFVDITIVQRNKEIIITPEQMVASVQPSQTLQGHVEYKHEIVFEPNETVMAVARTQSIKRRDHDYDIFTTNDPTEDGISFELQFIGIDDVEVDAHAFHSSRLKKKVSHDPRIGRYAWELSKPVLIHQGGFVMWKTKRKAPRASKQALPNPDQTKA